MTVKEYNMDDFEHVTLRGNMAYTRTNEYIRAANVKPCDKAVFPAYKEQDILQVNHQASEGCSHTAAAKESDSV